MRAKMSTGAQHAEDGSRYVPGFNVVEAEREARAILAEAEGPTDGGRGWLVLHANRGTFSRVGNVDALRSLAEALAAFVDEGN